MKICNKPFKGITAVLTASLLMSCQAPELREIIFEDKLTQLQSRSIQSRTFDMSNRIEAMRAVITTLQDLDFVIDQADSRLGIITATKLQTYHLRITVKVDDRSSGRILVRAQLNAGPNPVGEVVYQEFFESLGKNFFLTPHFVPLPKSFGKRYGVKSLFLTNRVRNPYRNKKSSTRLLKVWGASAGTV